MKGKLDVTYLLFIQALEFPHSTTPAQNLESIFSVVCSRPGFSVSNYLIQWQSLLSMVYDSMIIFRSEERRVGKEC